MQGAAPANPVPAGIAVSAAGIITFIIGAALLWDDLKDIPNLSTPNHPSPAHHWQLGTGLLLGGLATIGAGLLGIPPRPMKTF